MRVIYNWQEEYGPNRYDAVWLTVEMPARPATGDLVDLSTLLSFSPDKTVQARRHPMATIELISVDLLSGYDDNNFWRVDSCLWDRDEDGIFMHCPLKLENE